MINKILKNQRGFSLIEAVVALGLFGAGIYGVFEGIDMIGSQKNKAYDKIDLEIILSSTLEEIRSNISLEKIDFQAKSEFLDLSTYSDVRDSLVMRWDKNGITTAAGCGGCKGRLGYVVTPYKVGDLSFNGLYFVNVRVTHDDLFPNQFRQYKFIVRGP